MTYPLHKQRGIVLIIMTIVMTLAAIAYLLASISTEELQIDRLEQNYAVLKKAKRALIADALTNHNRPASNPGRIGNLPCPDKGGANPEGAQDPNCDGTAENTIGYFPWKRMGLEALKDATGTCLFYAVSPGYKLTPGRMLNEDSTGLFQIVDQAGTVLMGVRPEDRPVAIVFAANEPLPGQARNFDDTSICGLDYNNIDAYLDDDGITDNASLVGLDDTIDQFVHATTRSVNAANPVNDNFVTISQQDIWSPLMARDEVRTRMRQLTEAMAVCLADYANANAQRRLPWPAEMDLSGSNYFDDDNYDDVNNATQGYAGRYPYIVDDSNSEIGGIADDEIFKAAGCTSIDLPSTAAVVETINLQVGNMYGDIWHNWKDHFFYALSKDYEPDNGSEGRCNGMNDCVSVNGAGNKFAAIVFFSGSSVNGVARTSPEAGDADQKSVIANYLENNNAADFPDVDGEANYESGIDGNDILFCITDEPSGNNLNVTAC